jgi:hypothetical protein
MRRFERDFEVLALLSAYGGAVMGAECTWSKGLSSSMARRKWKQTWHVTIPRGGSVTYGAIQFAWNLLSGVTIDLTWRRADMQEALGQATFESTW